MNQLYRSTFVMLVSVLILGILGLTSCGIKSNPKSAVTTEGTLQADQLQAAVIDRIDLTAEQQPLKATTSSKKEFNQGEFEFIESKSQGPLNISIKLTARPGKERELAQVDVITTLYSIQSNRLGDLEEQRSLQFSRDAEVGFLHLEVVATHRVSKEKAILQVVAIVKCAASESNNPFVLNSQGAVVAAVDEADPVRFINLGLYRYDLSKTVSSFDPSIGQLEDFSYMLDHNGDGILDQSKIYALTSDRPVLYSHFADGPRYFKAKVFDRCLNQREALFTTHQSYQPTQKEDGTLARDTSYMMEINRLFLQGQTDKHIDFYQMHHNRIAPVATDPLRADQRLQGTHSIIVYPNHQVSVSCRFESSGRLKIETLIANQKDIAGNKNKIAEYQIRTSISGLEVGRYGTVPVYRPSSSSYVDSLDYTVPGEGDSFKSTTLTKKSQCRLELELPIKEQQQSPCASGQTGTGNFRSQQVIHGTIKCDLLADSDLRAPRQINVAWSEFFCLPAEESGSDCQTTAPPAPPAPTAAPGGPAPAPPNPAPPVPNPPTPPRPE